MKRILLGVLAVLFLLGFSGCGKELNDENFVDFYIETYDKDNEYIEELAEDYGWSHVDRGRYLDELKGDDERATFVYEAVALRDSEAARCLKDFEGISRHLHLKLNDENFATYWLEAFEVENEADFYNLNDEYGWTDENMNKYFEELKGDQERADKLIESINTKNEDAAFALELTLFPDRVFEGL